MRAFKEHIRRNYPNFFDVLRRARARVTVEYRVLQHLRLADVARIVRRPGGWMDELPSQRVLRLKSSVSASGDLLEALASEFEVPSGGHSIYLSPQIWRSSVLAGVAQGYPTNAGLKLVRNRGGVDEASYVHGAGHSHIQGRLLYSHRHMTLVANALHRAGLGPRLYDLCEIAAGDSVYTAYVIDHVHGVPPNDGQYEAGIARLKALVADQTLGLVAPGGFEHSDFARPHCNGNAVVDASGRFQYLDFQNFVLPRYTRDLRALASEAARASHFGDRSWLRGGTYLYQSLPGVELPAKRSCQLRREEWSEVLARHGESVEGRVVIDVGCNIGGMMSQYLAMGARWAHGFDRAHVSGWTERVLLGLGCTRFSVSGLDLDEDVDLLGNLPHPVVNLLHGAVISYLAIRGHVGWIRNLTQIPWRVMLYEGHEDEDIQATKAALAQLDAMTPIDVLEVKVQRDGDSAPRVIAIVRRR